MSLLRCGSFQQHCRRNVVMSNIIKNNNGNSRNAIGRHSLCSISSSATLTITSQEREKQQQKIQHYQSKNNYKNLQQIKNTHSFATLAVATISSTSSTTSSSSSSSSSFQDTQSSSTSIIHQHPNKNQENHEHYKNRQDKTPRNSSSSSSSNNNTSSTDPIIDMAELQALANQPCTPLKLADMYKYAVVLEHDSAQRLRNAQFLHAELQIRIAQRAIDLLTLPHGLNQAEPIQQVANIYIKYLQQLQQFPKPITPDMEHEFTNLLQTMVLDRTTIPIAIAQGVNIWTTSTSSLSLLQQQQFEEDDDTHEQNILRLQEMEDALERFFTGRVGLRFLTEHHILSSPLHNRRVKRQQLGVTMMSSSEKGGIDTNNNNTESSQNINDDDDDSFFLGCIQTDCDPVKQVEKAAQDVIDQTTDYYGICPAIEIVHPEKQQNDDGTTSEPKFTYVPHHLQYMVGELLKNSCRATVKKFLKATSNHHNVQVDDNHHGIITTSPPTLEPIRVVIVKGEEDITIKIADKGGGISRSKVNDTLWKFATPTPKNSHPRHYNTTTTNITSKANNNNDNTSNSPSNATTFGIDPMTSLKKFRGFGLPLARIYARYFGGELTIKSMEGYGVDAYLHLPRLGDNCENLPTLVTTSPGERDSTPSKNTNNNNNNNGLTGGGESSNRRLYSSSTTTTKTKKTKQTRKT